MVVFTAAGQWAQFQKISAIVLRSEDYIFSAGTAKNHNFP